MVKLNGNYKQGKKCAKLAVMLGVKTPVATALSLCALSALIAHDERYLGKYIQEVIAKGRDLPVVHELCIRIMESPFVPAVMEEIYACALLNAPVDKLMETLDLIQNHRCARKRRAHEELEINDKLVIDAMTEDDVMYADALQLASDFKMNDWPVHFASLENALTSLDIHEAKAILKARGHLARLRSDPDRLHSQLRTLVGPLMTTNEQFIAYLSLFGDGQPERSALPVLKRILEKKRDLKAVRLFTDADYLYNLILSVPDRVILSLVDGILSIPVGVEACEAAARILLDGTDIRPAASPAVIFALLGKDEANFIDLVACKTSSEELQYLERAALILEATPNADSRLLEVVRLVSKAQFELSGPGYIY
ncbi:hypothetical protein TELCIR_10469 [Teladorsagia circumcincta]|uniref:Uncharacterized protein n=1 Tax=Teladorsagia circumcincta TaxID=45464 RepID=A0A2G9UDG7_TELCI|nr:hypothetical protein TELCIR_10469 [Teladorsagia circumcincta]